MTLGWYSTLSRTERRTFLAAFGGLALDAMDSTMFALLTPTLIVVLGITHPQAGLFATANLVGAALGGWVFGMVADRIGRVRVLQITVLLVALSTFAAAFAEGFTHLLIARAVQGFGYGGEAAVGAVLVAEVVAPAVRGRVAAAVQSGYAVGNATSVALLPIILGSTGPDLGWRIMFSVGLLPALIVFFVRRLVPESALFVADVETRAKRDSAAPSVWLIFRPPHLRQTLVTTSFATGALGAAFVMITWLPTYVQHVLGMPLKQMAGYLAINILGSFCGPVIFGLIADRIGRRRAFLTYLVLQACNVVIFTQAPIGVATTVVLGFFLGLFQAGIASGIMPTFSELFPTEIRATGAGFALSAGRGIGSIIPATVGFMSTQVGLGNAMAVGAVVGYAIALLVLIFMPRRDGVDLGTVDHGDIVRQSASVNLQNR
jgi:MFS family permease